MKQHSPQSEESKFEPAPAQCDSMEDKAIAQRAYEYWNERGCPDGSPEEDWYRAERELKSHRGMLPPKIPD
jgi:hypothetical protein